MNIRVIPLMMFLLAAACARAWQTNQTAGLVLGSNKPQVNGIVLPRGLAIDPVSGKLFVADNMGRVLRYAADAKFLNLAPPEAVLGKPDLGAPPSSSITQTNLLSPIGIAMDNGGRLWVADQYRILRWDNAATRASGSPADGVLGGPDFTSYWPNANPGALSINMYLAVDSAGSLYASLEQTNKVFRFDAAASKPNGAAADAVFGQTTLTGTGAALSATRLSAPREIVLRGPALWILDSGNARILRLNNAASRTSGAAFDAVIGQESMFSNTSTTLQSYHNMAISPSGTLLLTHQSGVKRIYSWPGIDGMSGLLPAPGTISGPIVAGRYGSSIRTMLPDGGNRLWVGLTDETLGQVARLENLPAQTTPDNVLGRIDTEIPVAPWQAAVDPVSGKVFVADSGGHGVLRYANYTSLVSHAPPEIVLGTGSAVTASGLDAPHGLCLDSSGRLWVADTNNNRVLRWNNAASIASYAPADAVIGQPNFTSEIIISPPNEASLNQPYGVAVNAAGTLWVLDYGTARAVRYDNAAGKTGQVPADGILGKNDFYSPWSSGLPGRFYQATRMQIDVAGRLWIMDTGGVNEAAGNGGNEIRLFRYDDPDTKAPGAMPDATVKFLYSTSTDAAHAFAVTPDNILWVASNIQTPRLNWYTNATGTGTGTATSGQIGSGMKGDGPGDFGGALAALNTDPAGNLWVADPANRRVMRFNANPTPPAAEPGQIFAVNRDARGFQLSFGAVPGRYYNLEVSPDLQHWTPTAAIVRAVTPGETLVDPAPAGSRQFYRARLLE